MQTIKKNSGLLLLFAVPLLFLPGTWAVADDAAGKHVVLHIESPGKFEVLHSRAQSTSTGAVFFGLIGAGIEESHRKGKDDEKEEAILEHIPDDACESFLVDEFTTRLEAKGIGADVVHEKPSKKAGENHIVRLKIDACGFRMMDSTDSDMAAYIVAQYRIYEPGETISGKLEELTIIGRNHQPWEALMADYDGAVEEFRDVKRKAGARLANKIIYLK